MKVCISFELKKPTDEQMLEIINKSMPDLEPIFKKNIIIFLQGDLRKLKSIYQIYSNYNSILKNDILNNILNPKSYNEDTKEITKKLINNKYNIDEHLTLMNETDRTIVGLLWHENIVDTLNKSPKKDAISVYSKILDNFCFADYIDRITFQKQIWQFNEMTSLIKTFHNNYIHHHSNLKKHKFNPSEVRFTKVLTKYSTEYNNLLFIQNLCQDLGLDKKDMLSLFLEKRQNYQEEDLYSLFELYDISKLDINRIYRYIDKYTKETNNEEEIIEDF
jgi:hypothetical protein